MAYYYTFCTDRDPRIFGRVTSELPIAHLAAGADITLGKTPGYEITRYRVKSVLLSALFGLELEDQNILVEVFATYPTDDED